MLAVRRQRRWLSCWLILALLFSQWAIAAHACAAAAAHRPADAAAMTHMPGCDGSHQKAAGSDPSALCKAHCGQGSQAFGAGVALDLPWPALLLVVLDWSVPTLATSPAVRVADAAASGAAPPGSPPLYLSLLVLRN